MNPLNSLQNPFRLEMFNFGNHQSASMLKSHSSQKHPCIIRQGTTITSTQHTPTYVLSFVKNNGYQLNSKPQLSISVLQPFKFVPFPCILACYLLHYQERVVYPAPWQQQIERNLALHLNKANEREFAAVCT